MNLEEMKALSPEKQKALFDRLSIIRHQGKTTNYSSQYGVGKKKLARELQIQERQAEALLKAYWEVNWAIKECAERVKTRRVKGQDWLYNPINGFWYFLRTEKDRYSTLVQGTGAYCFDLWLREIRSKRPQLTAQFHDEAILEVKIGHREECEKLLRDAIQRVNDKLKLNVELGIDVQFGASYDRIH